MLGITLGIIIPGLVLGVMLKVFVPKNFWNRNSSKRSQAYSFRSFWSKKWLISIILGVLTVFFSFIYASSFVAFLPGSSIKAAIDFIITLPFVLIYAIGYGSGSTFFMILTAVGEIIFFALLFRLAFLIKKSLF